MKLKSLLLVGAMSAGLASMAAFQDAKIWQRPLQPTPAGGGAEMFLDYCAS